MKVKSFLKRILSNYYRKRWKSVGKVKVLIRTNKYFSEDSWLETFGRCIGDYQTDLEVICTESRYSYAKLVNGADIIFSYNFDKDLLRECNSLKMFYLGVRGTEEIENVHDFESVKFYSVPAFGKSIIADYVLMCALMLNRRFHSALKNQFKNKWEQEGLIFKDLRPLRESVIGVAGFGNIGKEVAERFMGIGCKVVGLDKQKHQIINSSVTLFSFGSIEAFLANIDILVIALPLNKNTEYLIDFDKLKLLRKGSLIINVSRGEILGEGDLVKALESGHIAGAALDVFTDEPLPKESKLWRTDNVIISPHIAGNINLFVDDIQNDFCNKVTEILGKKCLNS